jgi:flagellar motor switch protein FliN
MAGEAERNETLQWLVRTLSDQLSQVFDTMAGESPLIEAEQLASAPGAGEALVWEVGVNAAPAGPILVVAAKASWYGLGNRILLAAGLEGSDDQTIQDTFKEALDQALAGTAREMTGKAGREVTAASGKLTTAQLPDQASWQKLELIFADNQPTPLNFGFKDELLSTLMTKSAVPAAKSAAVAAAGSSQGGESAGGRPESQTLDLLLDVELPISVSFGRAHLPLKEVMKLTTGSIVELNRTISEPVDIIVNNCVIARGEVVVVEGNFGVRIHEVISRQERLRTLY